MTSSDRGVAEAAARATERPDRRQRALAAEAFNPGASTNASLMAQWVETGEGDFTAVARIAQAICDAEGRGVVQRVGAPAESGELRYVTPEACSLDPLPGWALRVNGSELTARTRIEVGDVLTLSKRDQ